jgi:hypothetical protein
MRKRLRKKKHVGEFRQYGFSIACRLREAVTAEEFDSFMDRFLAEAIEARGLAFTGGGSPKHNWNGVVCRDHRYDSTTESDRAAVEDWLRASGVVHELMISPMRDVGYGPDPYEATEL